MSETASGDQRRAGAPKADRVMWFPSAQGSSPTSPGEETQAAGTGIKRKSRPDSLDLQTAPHSAAPGHTAPATGGERAGDAQDEAWYRPVDACHPMGRARANPCAGLRCACAACSRDLFFTSSSRCPWLAAAPLTAESAQGGPQSRAHMQHFVLSPAGAAGFDCGRTCGRRGAGARSPHPGPRAHAPDIR